MKKIIHVLILFFTLSISLSVNAQDLLKSKDLSTIQVDYLSNDDIAKISAQLKSNNATIDQVESMALSKGMSQTEINKLRIKLAQFEKKKPKTIDSEDSKAKATDKNSEFGRQQDIPMTELISHHQNKELYFDLSLTGTDTLEPGDYMVKWILTDENSGQTFDIVKEFTLSQ